MGLTSVSVALSANGIQKWSDNSGSECKKRARAD